MSVLLAFCLRVCVCVFVCAFFIISSMQTYSVAIEPEYISFGWSAAVYIVSICVYFYHLIFDTHCISMQPKE